MIGLCESCAYMKEMRNDRGSVFLMCRLSKADSRYPKYPRLPVLSCDGYRNRTDSKTGEVTPAVPTS